MRIDDRVRLEIKKAGIGVHQLARMVGKDVAMISRFINGKGNVSVPTLCDICELLELELVRRSELKTAKKED